MSADRRAPRARNSSAARARVVKRAPRVQRARVHVTWRTRHRLLDDAAVARAVRAALAHGGRARAEVAVVFVTDRALARLHGEWLGDPAPTDVITFELGEDGGGPAGELYVSAECARRVAAARGVAPARELALYVVHGALHLCGFDDRTPRKRSRMRAAESEVLAQLGYAPDPLPFR